MSRREEVAASRKNPAIISSVGTGEKSMSTRSIKCIEINPKVLSQSADKIRSPKTLTQMSLPNPQAKQKTLPSASLTKLPSNKFITTESRFLHSSIAATASKLSQSKMIRSDLSTPLTRMRPTPSPGSSYSSFILRKPEPKQNLKSRLADDVRGSEKGGKPAFTNMPLRKTSKISEVKRNLRQITTPTCTDTSLLNKSQMSMGVRPEQESAFMLRMNASRDSFNRIFDAFCIAYNWNMAIMEAKLNRTIANANKLQATLLQSNQTCEDIRKKFDLLLEDHSNLQLEHNNILNKQSSAHKAEIDQIKLTLNAAKEKEVEQFRQLRDDDLTELQQAYKTQLSEERKTWAGRLADKQQDFLRKLKQQSAHHEDQISEITSQNARRVNELENRLKTLELDFAVKVDNLQCECNTLRRIPVEVHQATQKCTETADISTQCSWFETNVTNSNQLVHDYKSVCMSRTCSTCKEGTLMSALLCQSCQISPHCLDSSSSDKFKSMPRQWSSQHYGDCVSPQTTTAGSVMAERESNIQIEEEINSLNSVLQLKNDELVKLRHKTMEQDQQLETITALSETIKQLRCRNEDLEALLTLRSEGENNLHIRYQTLLQSLDMEIKEKKKLSMDCDELRYKLFDVECKYQEIREAAANNDPVETELESRHISSQLMASSVYSSVRERQMNKRIARPISETVQHRNKSNATGDLINEIGDGFPAGSFISLSPNLSSSFRHRGLQHDRSKRRTIAEVDFQR